MSENITTEEVMEKIIKDLQDYYPHRCNILVFGESGGGKSSFLNNLGSSTEQVIQFARVRNAGEIEQCTREYSDYPVYRNNVILYDTWGFLNYKEEQFMDMIDGKVRSGTSYKEDSKLQNRVNQKRIIDVVVFVFDITKIASIKENPQMLSKLKIFYQIAKSRKNLLTYAVLTKIDVYWKVHHKYDIITNNQETSYKKTLIIEDQVFKTCRDVLQQGFGDPTLQVFPIINYGKNDSYADPLVDTLREDFCEKLVRDHSKIDLVFEESIPFRTNLFKSEMPINLHYNKKEDVEVQRPVIRSHKDFRDFVITDLKYKCCTLENYAGKFRLFVCGSLSTMDNLVCGLLFLDEETGKRIYFECLYPDERLLTRQFDENNRSPDLIPEYEFLAWDTDRETWVSQDFLDRDTSIYCRLSFCGGGVELFLKRKYFSNPGSGSSSQDEAYTAFHALIEHTIQADKRKKEIANELRRMKNDFKNLLFQMRQELENKFLLSLQQTVGNIETFLNNEKKKTEQRFIQFTEVLNNINGRIDGLTSKFDLLSVSNQQEHHDFNTKIDETLEKKIKIQEGFITEKFGEFDTKIVDISKKIQNVKALPDPPFEDSRIVGKDKGLRRALNDIMGDIAPHPLGRSIWKCIYRGSDHGYRAKDFHKKVKNVFRTVTVVLSDTGYIFGGYNPLRWEAHPTGIFKNFQGPFIFGLNCRGGPVKFPLKGDNNAIRCCASYMPTWGLGYDLYISDDCKRRDHSRLNLGNSYHNYGMGPHVLNGDVRKFKVMEIEVWTVEDPPPMKKE